MYSIKPTRARATTKLSSAFFPAMGTARFLTSFYIVFCGGEVWPWWALHSTREVLVRHWVVRVEVEIVLQAIL
jgi:hypothetical protein